MFKVLFVDDEVLIREAISKNLNWNSLGYEIAATCKNGKEAIHFIQKNSVDLIITDVCMPYVDGLDLAKYVYENFPDTYVIILSGYDDFDYAKKAVKYQVKDYILKPVTSKELSNTLLNIKKKLQKDKTNKNTMLQLQIAYKQGLSIERAYILNQLISGSMKNLSNEVIEEKLMDAGFKIKGNFLKSIIALPNNTEQFINQLPKSNSSLKDFVVYNLMGEWIPPSNNIILFQNLKGQTVLLVGYNEEEEFNKIVNSLYSSVKKSLNDYFKMGLIFGIGYRVQSYHDIYISYEGSIKILDYLFYFDKGKVLDIDHIDSIHKDLKLDLSNEIEDLIDKIKFNNKSDVKEHIDHIFGIFQNSLLPVNEFFLLVQNIISSISKLVDTISKDDDKLLMEANILKNKIYKSNSLNQVKKLLIHYSYDIMNYLLDYNENFEKRYALLATRFINENYSNPNLSLQDVCNYLSVSVSYFSNLFKKYTGKTFIEALTDKRISIAMKLLTTTSLKIYEVADRVGFNDPQYFATTFKKYTGHTPKAYAKKERQG